MVEGNRKGLNALKKNAGTLLLFDNRTQQFLNDVAQNCKKGSYEHSLIVLSQASMGFYNALLNAVENIVPVVASARKYLKVINLEKLDPLNRVLYLKLIADMELRMAKEEFEIKYQKNQPSLKESIFTNHDEQARKCLTKLVKALPKEADISIKDWHTDWITLTPLFDREVISFYKPTATEKLRDTKLKEVLKRTRDESLAGLGVIDFKQYMAAQKINPAKLPSLRGIISRDMRKNYRGIKNEMLYKFQDAKDVKLPKRIRPDALKEAMIDVDMRLSKEMDGGHRAKFTTTELHLGILRYLSGDYTGAIRALVDVLKNTKEISPDEKKLKANRHEEFPDIPFMIGSSYLLLALEKRDQELVPEEGQIYLEKAKSAFEHAIKLFPQYHQAFHNQVLVELLLEDGDAEKSLEKYIQAFDGMVTKVDARVFQALALKEFLVNNKELTPKVAFYLLLHRTSEFDGSEVSETMEMLADLKTLKILNSHEIIITYYQKYLGESTVDDSPFVLGLQNDSVHSAILHYFAYAFCSTALKQEEKKVNIDYERLSMAIELNFNSLFFYKKNPSALRLIETTRQVLQYGLNYLQKSWETLYTTSNMGVRLGLYEDYLRNIKSRNFFNQKLLECRFEKKILRSDLSAEVKRKMESLLTREYMKRIHEKVMGED